jgi:hypothetical protein
MSFTSEELAYLRSQPLARVATVSPDGLPDVVPLAFEFDGTFFWVGGTGPVVANTRKFQNVRAGNHKVALVIDDLCPSARSSPDPSGSTAMPSRRSNATDWWAWGCICASPRPSPGAGIWPASRRAIPGMRRARPCIGPRPSTPTSAHDAAFGNRWIAASANDLGKRRWSDARPSGLRHRARMVTICPLVVALVAGPGFQAG